MISTDRNTDVPGQYSIMKQYYLAAILSLLLCMPTHSATLTVSVKDLGGKPLANTVVYIQTPDSVVDPQAGEIRIEQKGKEFRPFVSVAPPGTTAQFPNHDGIGHHVYSFSPAKTFDMPLSEEVSSESVVFDKPGIITVGCNIHDWMVGYIYVIDTPYYAVSDETGQLVINNIPAGNYMIHVWHPGLKSAATLEHTLQVNGTEPVQQDFSLDIRPEYFWKPPRPPELEEEEY